MRNRWLAAWLLVPWLIMGLWGAYLFYGPFYGSEEPDGVIGKEAVIAALRAQDFDQLEAWYKPADAGAPSRVVGYFAFNHSHQDNLGHLTAWIEERPLSPVALLARGVHYRHLGELSRRIGDSGRMRAYFGNAIEDFRAALQLNPKLELAYAYMASMARRMGNRADAYEIRRIGLKEVPDAPLIHAMHLMALDPAISGRSQSDFEVYLDSVRALHGDDPRFAYIDGYLESSQASQTLQVRSDAGEALFRDFLLPKAMRLLDQAIELQPTIWRYRKRAKVHIRNGDLDRALADLESALAIDPRTPYIRALDIEVDAPHLHVLRADILWELERLDEAQEAYDRAIRLDPRQPTHLKGRAKLHRWIAKQKGRQGDIQGYIDHRTAQIEDLRTAADFAKNSAELQRLIGQYWLTQFRPSLARFAYQRATSLAPKSTKAWLGRAESLYYEGDCWAVDALKRYIELCRAKGNCSMTHTLPNAIRENMGWCRGLDDRKPADWHGFVLPDWIDHLARCGRRFHDTYATAALQECLDQANAGDPASQYDLGQMLFRGSLRGLQNFEKAVEWLRRASDQGYADAQALLGEKYVFGIGVDQDKEEGLRLLDLAIRQNSPEGYLRLGSILYAGRLLPEDKQRGRALIAKAAELGHSRAKQVLDRMPDG